MYKQNRSGWSKHFDFFFLDVILLELAFFLCYGLRHDWIFFYNMDYYRRAGLFLAFISICTAMFRESYHGIIRRGYLEELKAVVVHVSIVEIALIAITFFMKDLYYSREGIYPLLADGRLLLLGGTVCLEIFPPPADDDEPGETAGACGDDGGAGGSDHSEARFQ